MRKWQALGLLLPGQGSFGGRQRGLRLNRKRLLRLWEKQPDLCLPPLDVCSF
jgi:hypothetical protein